MTYAVMANTAGCLPEQDPEIYDSMWDAMREYIERLRWNADNIEDDEEFLTVDTALIFENFATIALDLLEVGVRSFTIEGTVYSVSVSDEEATNNE